MTRYIHAFATVCRVASILPGLFLLATGSARSQEAAEAPKTSLRPGVWALEFGAQPVVSSGFFSTAGMAIKHHVSERTAVRVGFFVDWSDDQSDGTHLEVDPPYLISGRTTEDTDEREYSVYAHIQRAFSVSGRTAVELFAGPTASWLTYEGLDRLFLNDGSERIDQVDYDSWYAGLELGAGFEWFWTERVSLGAHYAMVAQYGEWDRSRSLEFTPPSTPYRYEDIDHGKSFRMTTTGSYLRLAAYF